MTAGTSFLVGTRTTHDGRRRIEPLMLDLDMATEMAGVGQSLLISGCSRDQLIRHLKYATKTIETHGGIVCCSSYELADDIGDALREFGVSCSSMPYDANGKRNLKHTKVLVATPPQLYLLRSWVRDGTFRPGWLFYVDPAAATFSRRITETFDGVPAACICSLRAAAAAVGLQIPVVLWTTAPCCALGTENLCRHIGCEAMVYVDGKTVRTASLYLSDSTVEAELATTDADLLVFE